MSIFHSPEVMGLGSETQLQVGEKYSDVFNLAM